MMETQFLHSGPSIAAGPRAACFDTWQALAAPGDVFRHPREVLAHPLLTTAEKRAILASWASDASALENAPDLRCLSGCRAEPVSIDAVLAALSELDRAGPRPATADPATRARARRPLGRPNPGRLFRRSRRDDDDPPPCPAAAMPRPRTPSGTTWAVAVPA